MEDVVLVDWDDGGFVGDVGEVEWLGVGLEGKRGRWRGLYRWS